MFDLLFCFEKEREINNRTRYKIHMLIQVREKKNGVLIRYNSIVKSKRSTKQMKCENRLECGRKVKLKQVFVVGN